MASISKRNGKYLVRWSSDENGERKFHGKTFELRRDAAAFKVTIESDTSAGRLCEYSKITLAAYLHDFFDTYSTNLTGNTEHCNRRYMENHIIPRLGNIRVRDLTAMDIQKAYNDIMATPYRPAETKAINGVEFVETPAKFYSAKTILNIHGVLTKALKHAVVVQRLIPFNPCDGVILPKVVEFEGFVPSQEQIDKLLVKLRESRFYEAILADVLLGIRRSECLGLFWSDIDFNAHEISIERALIYDEATHQLALKDTKSKSSHRVLQMPPEMEEVLKNLKVSRAANEKNFSDVIVRSPFVFVNESGLPIRPTTLSKVFKEAAVSAGLSQMRLHDLRHTAATYLLRAGLSPRAVQGIIGHSSSKFTMKKYAHMIDDDKKQAATVMQTLYFKEQ